MATIIQDHNFELKCRICAFDFKFATDGIPIFKQEHLLEKILKYLHINVSKFSYIAQVLIKGS